MFTAVRLRVSKPFLQSLEIPPGQDGRGTHQLACRDLDVFWKTATTQSGFCSLFKAEMDANPVIPRRLKNLFCPDRCYSIEAHHTCRAINTRTFSILIPANVETGFAAGLEACSVCRSKSCDHPSRAQWTSRCVHA